MTLCEILNIIAPYPLARWGRHDAMSIHYVTEAERLAYADRNAYLGDPDFVHDPVAQLLAPEYAGRLRAKSSLSARRSLRTCIPDLDFGERKCRYDALLDRRSLGERRRRHLYDQRLVRCRRRGWQYRLLLNDEMDDFTSKPGVPNLYGLVQGSQTQSRLGSGRCRRWRDDCHARRQTRNGDGKPGGSRIITIVLETLSTR